MLKPDKTATTAQTANHHSRPAVLSRPRPDQMQDAKIPIAIIAQNLAPYRIHTYGRVVREMPEIHLWTVCTHEDDPRWTNSGSEGVGSVISFPTSVSPFEQGKHPVREWRCGGRIVRWLKRQGIRAVVLIGYNDIGRMRILNWCWKHQIPCFVWGDSNIENDKLLPPIKAFVKKLIVKPLLKRAAGAMAFGSRGRDYFQKYGVPESRVFYFPLEPDYEMIRGIPDQTVREVREQFGLADNRSRLLFCGRLVGLKRVDQLIDAFAAIAERRPQWDLVILGDGELREELHARVPQALQSRVIWTGHIADPTHVAAIFRACNVLVLASNWEAWALVVNEAAASGMAIVSSSIPGAVADLVRDGVNGRVFPAEDLDKLVECLLDVTQNGRAGQMGAASPKILEVMRKRFDPVQGLRLALHSAGALSRD